MDIITKTLILLPGLDGTGKLLKRFVECLGGDVHAEIISYPTNQPLGYDELEARVRDALPLNRPFVLLGESFSGPIAIRIAANPPPGLVGVILCGTFARNPYPLLGWASPLAFLVPLKSLPRWVRAPLMWDSRRNSRVPCQAERAIAGVSRAVIRRRIAALLTVDTTSLLARIALPTLVIYATRDRVVSYAATRWLTEHLPAAEVAAIDAPHLLLQAVPTECADAVLPFLERISVSETPLERARV